MARTKRYVVRKGKKTGIYNNWETCKQYIHGVPGAQYKAYPTQAQAKHAFKHGADSTPSYSHTYSPYRPSISVDAACSGNPGIREYQIVDTDKRTTYVHQGPFDKGTVNIAEFVGLVHAINYAQKNSITLIYTDSRTARSRVRQETIRSSLSQKAHEARSLAHRAKNYISEYKKNNTLFIHEKTITTQNHADILQKNTIHISPRDTQQRGEIPADFGRK